MDKINTTSGGSISYSNNELFNNAHKMKKILIAYMLILNMDNLLIYCFEIIFKNTIMISYIFLSALLVLLIYSETRNLNYSYLNQIKNLNLLVIYGTFGFVYCNFTIFYIFWYKIVKNENEYQRVYFKEEISKFVTIHIVSLLLYAILNLLFKILIIYNLLNLKKLFKKHEIKYTKSNVNQLPEIPSQIANNTHVLDLA